jgi:hypothetical protein
MGNKMAYKGTTFNYLGQEFRYFIHNPSQRIPPPYQLLKDESVVLPPRPMPEVITDEWLAEELIRGYSRDRTTKIFKESLSFRDALEDVVSINHTSMIVVFTKEGFFLGKIACSLDETSFTFRAMYIYGVSDRGSSTPGERISSASIIWHAVALEAMSTFGHVARVMIVMPRDTVYRKLINAGCLFVELQPNNKDLINSHIVSGNWRAFDANVKRYITKMLANPKAEPEDINFGALFSVTQLLQA